MENIYTKESISTANNHITGYSTTLYKHLGCMSSHVIQKSKLAKFDPHKPKILALKISNFSKKL